MLLRNYPYKLLLAALITGCFVFYSCENDVSKIPNFRDKRTALEEGHDIESYLSQNSKIKGKLTAPLMYRYAADSPYVEFPKTLHVDFFGDSSRVDSRLDCRYGKYFESQDKVYLRDSVILISVQGDTLKCQDLWWDQATQKFYTDKFAEYHARDKTIMGGKGLEATQDMTTVTFREPVGTVLTSGENGLQ
mgnify:CR=1 FL=1